MANPEHLAILIDAFEKKDIEIWNRWLDEQRDRDPLFHANLSQTALNYANLSHANFTNANLIHAHLSGANLYHANLIDANLRGADLSHADLTVTELFHADLSDAGLTDSDLSYANLSVADLSDADLSGANLSQAGLGVTNFVRADLRGADLTNSRMSGTILADVDLSSVKGLETIYHTGPSNIGIETLYKSRGNIPEIFLRGCGVPETMITFAKSLVGKPIQFYSAFISYSSKDEDFAKRLHADLQALGVRIWFAPEDLKIGDKFRTRIDEAIRIYDKLMVVLSENSVSSSWVEEEVEAALERERRENRLVLFPIRLDDAVMNTDQAWASSVRRIRHIGDFTKWKSHDDYQKTFERLLRDLNAEPSTK